LAESYPGLKAIIKIAFPVTAETDTQCFHVTDFIPKRGRSSFINRSFPRSRY
jgi:hypothetical protein